MKIEIIPYQARWPEEYKTIVTELKTAVGQWALAFAPRACTCAGAGAFQPARCAEQEKSRGNTNLVH